MSTLKPECRKFSPNVFNKTKCQNCFRTKEVHSAEALENNRASRNVSKCGYLFVAPDWDFNVSVNRTKRWQRRWFKLFDDGELTYALDEFPDTLPQGTIDMNKVLDVSDAETVTGNDFAIAITTPEKVHFIKGTSKEESKWWFDSLTRVLPRHLSRGKHKRNATFPCGKAIIPPASVISQDYSEDDIRLKNFSRPKFLSTSEIHPSDEKDWNLSSHPDGDEDVFSAKDEDTHENEEEADTNNCKDVEVKNALNKLLSESANIEETSQTDMRATDDKSQTSEQTVADESNMSSHRRNRRYLKRENRVQRNQRSRFEGVSKLIPSKKGGDKNSSNDGLDHSFSSNAIAASEKLEYLESIQNKEGKCALPEKDSLSEEKESLSSPDTNSVKNVAPNLHTKTNLRKSESLKNIPSESQSEMRDQVTGLRRYHSFRGPYSQRKSKPCGSSGQKKNKLMSNSSRLNKDAQHPTVHAEQPEVPTSNVNEEMKKEGVFMKTGWLLRQTLTKDWSRHWFVLKDSSLTYYRDSSAEKCGIMDGILDLNQVSSIRECESDRHYAFSLLMWDCKKHVLATENEDMRRLWIQAIQYASNLWSSESKEDFIKTEIVLPDHHYYHDRVSSPSSLASLPSVDDEKPSESSSSDDQSEYFSIVDEDEDSLCSMYRDEDMDMILSLQQIINENHLSYDATSCHPLEAVNGIDLFYRSSGEERLSKSEEEKTETEFSEADSPYVKTIHDDVFGVPANLSTSEECCYVCAKVKSKLIAAKEEIRKLREELREAHASYDNLEMFSYKLQQDIKLKEQSYDSQISLMTSKIDDLTSKFTLAERNYRQLKQKVAKGEYKQEKRKSSLKNKDLLSLSKEYESKLSELETKIVHIEAALQKDVFSGAESNSATLEAEKRQDSEASDSNISNTPTKLVSKESSNGLFSRLQTLGARVKRAGDVISERDDDSHDDTHEKPKICVQVREIEESNSPDISGDWRTLSISPNIDSLQSTESGDMPSDLPECQNLLSEKLQRLLEWLKNSLDRISKPINLAETRTDEKSLLIANVNEVLNYLYLSVPDDIKNSETKTVYYSVLLFSEVLKVMERINNLKCIDFLLKLNIVEWGFKVIGKILYNILIKREKSEFSGILNLTAEIPQIRHFCPMISKILPPVKNNDSFTSVSERLINLNEQRACLLKSLDEAKNVRFMSLWDTLSELPVQDDDVPSSQKVSPMLRYVMSVSSSIYKTAELHLSCFQSQSLHVLKTQHDIVHAWCLETSNSLRYNFGAFLEELKERCPMINELTIPVSELSAVSHKEITFLISELSFLNISSIILESALTFLRIGKENVSTSCVSYEKWISGLQKNFSSRANFIASGAFFECSQCSMLNYMFSNSESDILDYSDVFNPKSKMNGLNFELENFSSDLNNVCANCLDIYPESLLGTKGKDDCNNWNCSQCERLQVQLDLLEKEHESELNSLANNSRNELEILEQRLETNNELHEQEMRKKGNELETAVSELHRLKNEYEEQIQNFKNLYEQKLRFQNNAIEENTICEMYKREIEDIKDMFKKGLLAIENSHNRITTEMEKRHKDEIALLEAEKQKALELEAQATIKALEAIKNSHAKQLQDETTSIKEELSKRFQTAGQYESFYQKYGNELEELKAEILHVTDLYSEKCLENVTLGEKVSSLRQQLQEAHNELYELLIRNRDLDLHLSKN